METFTYLSSLGLMPSLATRPATALLVLSGAISLGWVAGPSWLLGFFPLISLFVIALVGWNIGKDSILIEFVETFIPFIKVILAFVISVVMLDMQSAEVLSALIS